MLGDRARACAHPLLARASASGALASAHTRTQTRVLDRSVFVFNENLGHGSAPNEAEEQRKAWDTLSDETVRVRRSVAAAPDRNTRTACDAS